MKDFWHCPKGLESEETIDGRAIFVKDHHLVSIKVKEGLEAGDIEEVKPARIELVNAVPYSRYLAYQFSKGEKSFDLNSKQIEAVEAALNGELFTKEDMMDLIKTIFINHRISFNPVYGEETFLKWLKSRNNAKD